MVKVNLKKRSQKYRCLIICINMLFTQGGLQSTVYQSDIVMSLCLFICVKKRENFWVMNWSSLLIM